MKQLFKNLIPQAVLKVIRPYYHGFVALAASYYFDEPSKDMTVVGITGTAGKSTTTQMLAAILNASGKKCGFITTIGFFDGDSEEVNKHGLSMPGGWLLQKQLGQMLKHGCKFAVVECTSEGLAQNRHRGIDFDYAVFTNLTSAHLEAHGSFENYKQAKGKLFSVLGETPTGVAKKTILANLDNEYAEFFLQFSAQQKIGTSFENRQLETAQKIYQGHKIAEGFELLGQRFIVKLPGEFNKINALLAVAAANTLGVELSDCARALADFAGVRGRMEFVPNNKGLKIIVDYGCEPASFSAALQAAAAIPHKRLIHVFGSTGGHRDISKRFEFGKTSARFADEIIITNDDVYDSDPEKIAHDIAKGIGDQSARQVPYEILLGRRQAIQKALSVAAAGDLVLITGKGSEQFLVLPGNKRIEWDDVGVVREELEKNHNL